MGTNRGARGWQEEEQRWSEEQRAKATALDLVEVDGVWMTPEAAAEEFKGQQQVSDHIVHYCQQCYGPCMRRPRHGERFGCF